eukprot:COSAG06_NODE_32_length_31260_cov_54.706973_7_plen_89_part_00
MEATLGYLYSSGLPLLMTADGFSLRFSPMIMMALPLPQVMPPQQMQQQSSIRERRSPNCSACHQAEAPQSPPMIMTALPLPQVMPPQS